MVDSFLIHPQFKREVRGTHYDIALVRTNAPFLINPPFTARLIQLSNAPANSKPPGEND
jgi:hypothetical protein